MTSLIFYILTASLAQAQSSKAQNCFFDGKGMGFQRICRMVNLDVSALSRSVAGACQNICDPAPRQGIKLNVANLKSQAEQVCSQAGTCSQEKLEILNGCLNGLAQAMSLGEEITKEAEKTKDCKSTDPEIS